MYEELVESVAVWGAGVVPSLAPGAGRSLSFIFLTEIRAVWSHLAT